MDIVERLRFDAARCEMQFSKGVAGNIEEAISVMERMRAALTRAIEMPHPSEMEEPGGLWHQMRAALASERLEPFMDSKIEDCGQ